jgi:hypothetical protein
MENEFLNRIKLLSVYDTKKTLNENKIIISEQEERSITDLVNAFQRATTSLVGTSTKGIMSVLNNITNKTTLTNFFNEIKNKTKKTFVEIINSEFEGNNHREAVELSKLLKTKFGIDSEPGISYFDRPKNTWGELKSAETYDQIKNMYKEFNKKFKITNFNWEIPTSSTVQPNQSTTNSNDVNSNNQPKVIGYNPDGSEIYDNQQPEQQPTQQQRVVPQTFNDVLQGKGFLKFGDKSPAVKELQEKLISIDYTVISRATGYFGNETRTAVQYFQNNSKLKPDLIVGKNTASALNNAVQLRQRRNQQQTQPIPSVQRGVPQSNIQAPITGIKR